MTRRQFMWAGAGIVAGFEGMRRRSLGAFQGPLPSVFGELRLDSEGVLDLPAGFSYHVFSRTGETMDDGFLVPGAHDGMAAFAGPDGQTLLVRNHELTPQNVAVGPFGPGSELRDRLDLSRIYDRTCPGGTTTLVYNTAARRLEKHFLSLVGTIRNCAGGPTPWGSWVSCEEATDRAGEGLERDHGYAFEVPASAEGPVIPRPLGAMGRFYREAVAVDESSGVVYQTEDRGDGLFYRFVPNVPGELGQGGRLQALRVRDLGVSTSNGPTIRVGQRFEVSWVDLENVEAPDDDLRAQGASVGAATFSRGEGVWAASGVVYFAATSGGANRAGQIWRYRPSPMEGTAAETSARGVLELFIEPNERELLDSVDNITVAPWGDVIICEDGPNGNYVRGVTARGQFYTLARNAMNDSEFAGATFSPDGTTLFLNIQRPGLTLAITGPWRR